MVGIGKSLTLLAVMCSGDVLYAHMHAYTDDKADYVVFFCGHIYHQRCVPKKNEVRTGQAKQTCHLGLFIKHCSAYEEIINCFCGYMICSPFVLP